MKANVQQKPAKNFREFERENEDVKKGEHIKVPLYRIRPKKGFNPRNLNKPATEAKIVSIQQAYEKGEDVPLIVVRMALDGEHAEIVDGECRYTAAVRADKAMRARGEKGIEWYEAIRFTGTELQAIAYAFKANEVEHLTPLEQSNTVRDMQREGATREQIAEFLGKGLSWIDRLIVISKLPDNIKKLVEDEKLAAELAVKMHKQHGADAYDEIMKKLNGGGRITPKDTKSEGDGDSEGDGGEGSAAPAKSKKVDNTEKKRVAGQYETAKSLAFALPDKIKKPRNIADDQTYPVELTGASIKLLLKLQDAFTPEIEAELKAQKDGGDE